MNHRTRELAIPLGLAASILGVVVAGSVAWGQMKSKVELLERQALSQHETEKKVGEIAVEQGILREKVDGLVNQQSEFREDTKDSLKRILRLLDRRIPPR